MPIYEFIEPQSKIKINGKWYNESNLDSEVVSLFLQYSPNYLGLVFKEKEVTLPINNEIVKEKNINGKQHEAKTNSKKETSINVSTDASSEV